MSNQTPSTEARDLRATRIRATIKRLRLAASWGDTCEFAIPDKAEAIRFADDLDALLTRLEASAKIDDFDTKALIMMCDQVGAEYHRNSNPAKIAHALRTRLESSREPTVERLPLEPLLAIRDTADNIYNNPDRSLNDVHRVENHVEEIDKLLVAAYRAAPPHPQPTAVGEWRDGYNAALRGDANRVGCYEREFYPLSNFSAFTLSWYGIRFDTSEAAYHWEKFPGNSGVQNAVQWAASAHEAFKIAERYRASRRPDWDLVKTGIMRSILRAKAEQHEYVRRKLLETGEREIVEDSWRDDYWGLGQNGDGQNWLGKLWMEIRAELRAHPPAPQVQAPQSNDPKCKFCGVPQSQLPWPICTDEVECDPDDDGVQVQAEGER